MSDNADSSSVTLLPIDEFTDNLVVLAVLFRTELMHHFNIWILSAF